MTPLLRTRLLITAGACGIFLLGAATGCLATLGIAKNRIAARVQASPAATATAWLDALDRKLDLSADQREAFQPVLEESAAEMQVIRRRALWASRNVLERAESSLRPQLSPAQQQAYDRLKQERQQRLRRALGLPEEAD